MVSNQYHNCRQLHPQCYSYSNLWINNVKHQTYAPLKGAFLVGSKNRAYQALQNEILVGGWEVVLAWGLQQQLYGHLQLIMLAIIFIQQFRYSTTLYPIPPMIQQTRNPPSTQQTSLPTYPQLLVTESLENGQLVHKYTIGKYQYSSKDFLGEGFSSNVYKATLLANRKEKFAIKVIDLSKYQQNQRLLLETEIDVIRSLNHGNVIRCVDVYKTQVNYFLVTEYCPHGDLSQLIKLQKYITEDKAIEIMKQILNGYRYMMSKNIIHRDLKPANIMRFGSQWKIGDFGFSCYCKNDYVLEKLYVGTPFYMPPQALQMSKYSYRSDIFALGIIFYEMLTGETPWPAKDEKELVDLMRENKLEIPRFLVSQESKQFLQKAIVLDYYERMSKEELKNFTFENVDLDKVSKLKPRGLSPSLKRQLSKSGKKSYIFATPIKFNKNSFFCVANKKEDIQVKSSKIIKPNFEYLKPHLQEHLGLESSPVTVKSFKQNCDIIGYELQFVKMLINLANNCGVLGLPQQQQIYLCLLIYTMSLKMLRMISTKRQNYYKLAKWDVFRESQKYRTSVSIIFTYITKIQHEYIDYRDKIGQAQQEKFSQKEPDLWANGSLNFKVYAKIFINLSKFVMQNVVKADHQSVEQTNFNKRCYVIRQILEFMNIVRIRTKRQQQVKGFGLKGKPQCLTFKNVSWTKQAFQLSLKQLQICCKHKIEPE